MSLCADHRLSTADGIPRLPVLPGSASGAAELFQSVSLLSVAGTSPTGIPRLRVLSESRPCSTGLPTMCVLSRPRSGASQFLGAVSVLPGTRAHSAGIPELQRTTNRFAHGGARVIRYSEPEQPDGKDPGGTELLREGRHSSDVWSAQRADQ